MLSGCDINYFVLLCCIISAQLNSIIKGHGPFSSRLIGDWAAMFIATFDLVTRETETERW